MNRRRPGFQEGVSSVKQPVFRLLTRLPDSVSGGVRLYSKSQYPNFVAFWNTDRRRGRVGHPNSRSGLAKLIRGNGYKLRLWHNKSGKSLRSAKAQLDTTSSSRC